MELKDIGGSTNGCASDERGNIIGLNLYHAKISDISFLNEFLHLTHLDIIYYKITDVSPILYLKNLRRLVLTFNHISQLPREFLQSDLEIKWKFDGRYGIFLEGNPLETPPVEVVKQGTAAVRNYFTQLEKAQVRLLHAKLLIVGNGEVGKTTLMKKLKDNHFQVEVGKEQTTHGINIIPWELNCTFTPGDTAPIKIHFWDFGGQDIYHATHQFFLTKRSLYLFVWEARKEEESRSFDYWLNIIKLLSAESPVIVVMNKADNRIKFIDEASFKDKFKNIVTFSQVSCVTGKGIPELTETIRSSLEGMDHLREKYLELVRLMEKFELCFPIAGTEFHIVPELLPAQGPALDASQYRQTGNLHFEYHYDFMPEGIISRFISRLYYLIENDHFWKNGVDLRFEDSLALVTAEPLNRKIKISVTGSCKSELLAITRNDFEHIHRTLNMEKNKHYFEMIPCTCSSCIQSPAPHFYKHDVLQMFNRKGLPNYCQVSGEEVPINILLKGIAPPEPRKDLLKTLLTAAHQLQGISKTIKPDEDSRSGFIALLLNIYGYYAKDQSRWGSSASGKSAGELDIKVENLDREGKEVTVYHLFINMKI